jgi:hypothetical protein
VRHVYWLRVRVFAFERGTLIYLPFLFDSGDQICEMRNTELVPGGFGWFSVWLGELSGEHGDAEAAAFGLALE